MDRSSFWEMFRRVEDDLWRACVSAHPSYQRGKYDGWWLCHRTHAEAHLRCIVELTPRAYPGLPDLLWLAKEQFAEIRRLIDGDDLVFAVGDIQ